MNSQTLPRKPPWIRSQLPAKNKVGKVTGLLRTNCLSTVCEEAACPNRGECFQRGTATFMIMGNTCTRNCRFCNIRYGHPAPLNLQEPEHLVAGINNLQLKYIVITSVTRDDLPDGGANHFVNCIKAIKNHNSELKIEILVPDFQHCLELALNAFTKIQPDVFNHNIETVPRLYQQVRPKANYQHSLHLLHQFKKLYPNIPTKSGIMLGLGETDAEIEQVLFDLRAHLVDKITLGQYLQPSTQHLAVDRYVTPEQFDNYAKLAKQLGFSHVASGPMVRSSYWAEL